MVTTMSKGNKRQKDDKANMKKPKPKEGPKTELTGFAALSHIFEDKK